MTLTRTCALEEGGHFQTGNLRPPHTQSPLDGCLTGPAGVWHRDKSLVFIEHDSEAELEVASTDSQASPRSTGFGWDGVVSIPGSPVSGTGRRALGRLEQPEKVPGDGCPWPDQPCFPGSPESGTCQPCHMDRLLALSEQ